MQQVLVSSTSLPGRGASRHPPPAPTQPSLLPEGAYDAVIIGAGPSGSTAGYYLAQGGAKVCMLDKEEFPRDKYCGDAVCTPALRILEDMGVMQQLRDANQCHYADSGGFVSPSGLCYIGEPALRARSYARIGLQAVTV